MEFSGVTSIALLFAFIAVIGVASHFAGEGIALATGSVLLRVLSRGLIRPGERRNLFGAHPKPQSGAVFYVENAQHFMYQNYVIAVGVLFWVLLLGSIFGYGANVHAL